MGFWWFILVCSLLIPVTTILAGWMMWKHCPKRISRTLGYRTARSMKNAETWKFAQMYCGRLWWKLGWLMVVPTLLFQLPFIHCDADIVSLSSLVIILVQLVLLFLTIIPTERALKRKFDEQGDPR